MSNSKKTLTFVDGPSGADRDRTIRHLVTMRESDRWDASLMEGMIQQTLLKVSHLPGAHHLQAAGMDVFRNPRKHGGKASTNGSSRQVLVQIEDVLYFYSMGSAAKSDEAEANAFASRLMRLIADYDPAELWVVAFTRLVRSARYSGQLLNVCQAHLDTIHCEVDIKPNGADGGSLTFQLLSMIAATERDYIVRRHTAGRVQQWRRGNWIPIATPPGYVKDSQSGRLVIDPEMVEPVRQMLYLLADHSKAPKTLAVEIGALGITTEKLKRRGLTVAAARNPSDVVKTMIYWADALGKGTYDVIWPNPFPGVEEIAGARVRHVAETDRYPNGVLVFDYDLPQPAGGWAPHEVFASIRARSAVTVTRCHDVSAPLSGFFATTNGDTEQVLVADNGDHYRVMQRAIDNTRVWTGWLQDPDTTRVARVRRRDLHQSIAQAVTAAVETGIPAHLDTTHYQQNAPIRLDAQSHRRRELAHLLEVAQDDHQRALRNMRVFDGDDEQVEVFRDDLIRAKQRCRAIEADLRALDEEAAPELGMEFTSSAALVAYAIGAVGQVDGSGPRALTEALRTVVCDESLEVTPTAVRWRLSIEVPHDEGVVVIGPISGEVPNVMRVQRTSKPGARPVRTKSGAGKARAALVSAGVHPKAALSAMACPEPELMQALLGEVTTSGCDPSWASLAQATYRNTSFAWPSGQWHVDDRRPQELLDLLNGAGGTLPIAAVVAAGFATNELRYLSSDTAAPTGRHVVNVTGRAHSRALSLIRCPHCDGSNDIAMRVPENPSGVLCSTCRRSPDPDSPIFPGFYFEHP